MKIIITKTIEIECNELPMKAEDLDNILDQALKSAITFPGWKNLKWRIGTKKITEIK